MAAAASGFSLRRGFSGCHQNHVRSEGQIVKKAVCIAIGVNLDSRKDVLGMMDITKKWIGRRQDWSQIHTQLAIYFSERMPE